MMNFSCPEETIALGENFHSFYKALLILDFIGKKYHNFVLLQGLI